MPSLRERSEEVFSRTLAQASTHPSLQPLRALLAEEQLRLRQPMRVAIVGRIKAGKSTMINALLGRSLVPTGAIETTYNVTWLRHGEPPAVVIHYKDGRPPTIQPFQTLAAAAARSDIPDDQLSATKLVEVFHPHPLLQTFSLIDTPGLGSVYEDDSHNTVVFLNLHGSELSAISAEQARGTDAVLYLFSKGAHTTDEALLSDFHGPMLGASPINAIGVLTRCDVFWPEVEQPLAAGAAVAQRLRDHPSLQRLLYTVQPTCGLLGLGAQELTAEEIDSLIVLAAAVPQRLRSALGDARRFSTRPLEGIPVPPEQRAALLVRLGRYGVWLACEAIRERGAVDVAAWLPSELLKHSGVLAVRELITRHFGQRALLIKLQGSIWRIKTACFTATRQGQTEARAAAAVIERAFDDLESSEHALREIVVLGHYYEGRLGLSAEEGTQLLQITGEYGTSCAARLGFDERTPVRELIPAAEKGLQQWRQRGNDTFGADTLTANAARVIAASFDRVLQHLREAERHLYLEE